MPPTDPPIDVTDILAQPREFAQRLARVERERAELIETVARLRAELAEYENGRWHSFETVQAIVRERDAARAEVARLRLALEDAYTVGDVVQMRLYIAAALRGQPAPAQPLDDDGVCKCGHARGQHRGVCMIFPCKCMEFTAPAQGQG